MKPTTKKKKARMKKHACGQWTYFGGMASCPHGYELLPDATTRQLPERKWRAHRAKISPPRGER